MIKSAMRTPTERFAAVFVCLEACAQDMRKFAEVGRLLFDIRCELLHFKPIAEVRKTPKVVPFSGRLDEDIGYPDPASRTPIFRHHRLASLNVTDGSNDVSGTGSEYKRMRPN